MTARLMQKAILSCINYSQNMELIVTWLFNCPKSSKKDVKKKIMEESSIKTYQTVLSRPMETLYLAKKTLSC